MTILLVIITILNTFLTIFYLINKCNCSTVSNARATGIIKLLIINATNIEKLNFKKSTLLQQNRNLFCTTHEHFNYLTN
jgi:hypothetical protein